MSYETIRVPVEAQLDAFFAQHTAGQLSKGLVYGITGPSGLTHCAGFGAYDGDNRTPDADTLFPIASMTKSFIACAALIARDHGLISLDDPITKYFPTFYATGAMDDPCDPPTLGMLLSMSGGLTEDNSWVDPFINTTREQLLTQVGKGLRYSHIPGTVYEYSNLGYTLAGLAVEQAAGTPIEQFVREQVLAPLELASTFFDNQAPVTITRATGYHLNTRGDWAAYPAATSDAFAAAGGIISTARDLATWVTWLGSAFRPARPNDVPILSRASRRQMQTMRIIEAPTITIGPTGALQPVIGGYGLGLRVTYDLRRGSVISHGGGLPGFSLFMCWHPASGHGIVTLTNSHRGVAGDVAAQALGQLLSYERTPSQTITPWPETLQLCDAAERLIRHWDDALAARILAPNVSVDRALADRRADIDDAIATVGPLEPARPAPRIVSATTPADLTWSIPAGHGELLCMIHLTPVQPAQIQEFVITAVPEETPRCAAPTDISPRRAHLGDTPVTPDTNVRVSAAAAVRPPAHQGSNPLPEG